MMSSASPSLPTDEPLATSDLIVGTSLWHDAWRRLRKNRMAVTGGVFVIALTLSCVAGPWIISATWGYGYETQNLSYGAQPPTWSHWFGTDFFGRDVLTRVLYGGRVSLQVGLLAAIVSATLGTVYGAVSGYAGGRIDTLMMRAVDILYALPYMFLVIILVTILGKNLLLIFLALGFVGWLMTARIVRGQVLSLKERDFVRTGGTQSGGERLCDCLSAPDPQYARADHRLFHADGTVHDLAGGVPLVSGFGRASAAAQPGRADQRRGQPHGGLLVGTGVSRHGVGRVVVLFEFSR